MNGELLGSVNAGLCNTLDFSCKALGLRYCGIFIDDDASIFQASAFPLSLLMVLPRSGSIFVRLKSPTKIKSESLLVA